MREKYSSSINQFLQNTSLYIINHLYHYKLSLQFVLLRVHSFVFTIWFSVIFGTGAVPTNEMLNSDVSGTHFGECYLIRQLWNVT